MEEKTLDLKHLLADPLQQKVLCPSCGFNYVHLGPVHISQGPRSYDVGNQLTIEKGADAFPRGSIVTLDMWCESRHRFQLEFQFHKGQTFVTARIIGDLEPDKTAPELWRG